MVVTAPCPDCGAGLDLVDGLARVAGVHEATAANGDRLVVLVIETPSSRQTVFAEPEVARAMGKALIARAGLVVP